MLIFGANLGILCGTLNVKCSQVGSYKFGTGAFFLYDIPDISAALSIPERQLCDLNAWMQLPGGIVKHNIRLDISIGLSDTCIDVLAPDEVSANKYRGRCFSDLVEYIRVCFEYRDIHHAIANRAFDLLYYICKINIKGRMNDYALKRYLDLVVAKW